MSQLLIDEVEDRLLASLQSRAVENGRTAAEEAREILTLALKVSENDPWAEDRRAADGAARDAPRIRRQHRLDP